MSVTATSTKTANTHAKRSDKFEGVVNRRLVDLATDPHAAHPDFVRQTPDLYMENVPEASDAIKTSWQPYHDARGSGFLDFDADGEVYAIIRPDLTNPAQVHRVGAPKAAPLMVTSHPSGIGNADGRPRHNDEFLYTKDTNGNEFSGLYLQKADGTVVELSEPGTRNNGAGFSPDGKTLIWTRTKPNDPTYTVMMMDDVDDPATRREVFVSPWPGSTYGYDLSPDKKTMLLGRYISAAESEFHVLDLASGQTREIRPTDGKISYGGATFVDGGQSILVTTDEGSEFTRLAKIDVTTGDLTILTPDVNWDVESFTLSPDQKTIAYTTNEDGISKLTIRDLATWDALPAPTLPYGIISGLTFDDTGRKLGFTLNASNTMGAPHTWDLDGQTLNMWVENDLGGLDPQSFVQPELIHYPNKNGDQIPAFIYRPKHLKPGETSPVLVEFHGGPEGQSRPYFDKELQYYVNELGITVIQPNVRGSDGYGKTYISLDNGENRKKSVEDGGDLLTWIATQPGLDANRIAVMGTSYGGYMTLAMLTDYPDKLVGGIDNVGISNFNTFLQNTEGYRRALRQVEYGNNDIPAMADFLERISPLTHAERIDDPLFVIQGANDPRVPMSEAEQMVNRVRQNGVPVWYMLGDEGHGFSKLPNIWEQRHAQTQFFQQIFGLEPKE